MIPFPLLFSFASVVGHACRGEDSKGVVEYCLNRGFTRIRRMTRILRDLWQDYLVFGSDLGFRSQMLRFSRNIASTARSYSGKTFTHIK